MGSNNLHMSAQPLRRKEDLVRALARGQPLDFLLFWSHRPGSGQGIDRSCLSQWFPSPFTVAGVCYPTAEHYMMAGKADIFGDLASRNAILSTPDPAAAKALGRHVGGFTEDLWASRRWDLVIEGNLNKFDQNPPLRSYLIGTGRRILVEASPRDPIWGIGLAEHAPGARNPSAWPGDNLLGFALMEVRSRLGGDPI
jgi:ribA/ribD-fused uncharacterized protein